MRSRSLVFAATGAALLVGSVLPAFADNWRQERREWREWHQNQVWRPYYAPPPAYVAPPAYSYYTPPPVYYGPSPGVSFGVTIR